MFFAAGTQFPTHKDGHDLPNHTDQNTLHTKQGIAQGPESVRQVLKDDIDDAVTYRSNQVLRNHKGQVCALIQSMGGCVVRRKQQGPDLVHTVVCSAVPCLALSSKRTPLPLAPLLPRFPPKTPIFPAKTNRALTTC